jgi:3-oxoacyl-[acyl-carrier protein] reductase
MSGTPISAVPRSVDSEIFREEVTSPARFGEFEKIQPGNEVHFSKCITADDLESFARLSGDRNPLHMDEAFAARTPFGRRVVHGMLLANYLSALVGMRCPGPGALWSQQNFRWHAPVFIGDKIQMTLMVKHKSVGSRTLSIEVKALNQDGKVVMDGDGTVIALEEQRQAEDLPITDRVAFVSCGSRGIGAAISSALARAGAAVVIGYRSNAAVAKELCSAIERDGGRAMSVEVDANDYQSLMGVAQRAHESFKHPIDLLVNNAGSLPEPRPFLQTTWEEMQSSLDVHLRGAFQCCQAMIPGMIEQRSGRIINIGSAFVRTTTAVSWSSFLVAKSAVHTLTRCLAAELGPHGIRVNTVSPGLVETEAISGFSERLRKVQAMQTPLRRLASPAEVAGVVTALCASAGEFVSGVEIPVCGGLQV